MAAFFYLPILEMSLYWRQKDVGPVAVIPQGLNGRQAMLSNTHFALAVHVLTALAYNEGKVVGIRDPGP